MLTRVVALALAVSASAVTFASYEFAMLVQVNKIVRYDPVNNVNLGSFGDGQLGFYSNPVISIDPLNPGQVAVMNADGALRRFDYSSGIYQSGASLGYGLYFSNGPMTITAMDNGNFVINGFNQLPSNGQHSRLHNNNGGTIASMLPFGVNYQAVSSTQGADGNIYTVSRFYTGSTWEFYTFMFNQTGAYQGYSYLGSNTNPHIFGNIIAGGSGLIISGGAGYNSPDTWTMPLGVLQSPTLVGAAGTLATGWTNWVKGHGGRLHRVHSYYNGSTYTNSWHTYDPLANAVSLRSMGTTTDQYTSLAMVVAPEPGSLGVLALGLAYFVRRRKR